MSAVTSLVRLLVISACRRCGASERETCLRVHCVVRMPMLIDSYSCAMCILSAFLPLTGRGYAIRYECALHHAVTAAKQVDTAGRSEVMDMEHVGRVPPFVLLSLPPSACSLSPSLSCGLFLGQLGVFHRSHSFYLEHTRLAMHSLLAQA
ncbi:hypothetical protein BD309DRAFT_956437 [Dichomitus squalens]|nr:hypothetical protein BD309DRAFT_956437 [Dichomitus squalens]